MPRTAAALADHRDEIIARLAAAKPRSERACLLRAQLRECTSALLVEELRAGRRRARPRLVQPAADLLTAAE